MFTRRWDGIGWGSATLLMAARYGMQTRQMRQTAIVHEKWHGTGESEAKTRGELVIQILFSAASPVLRIASSTTTSFNEDKMLNSSISRVPAH